MMAEAYGKATGRPGICFVTRGPGATNAVGRRSCRPAGFHAHDPVRRPGRAPLPGPRRGAGTGLSRRVRHHDQMGGADRRRRAAWPNMSAAPLPLAHGGTARDRWCWRCRATCWPSRPIAATLPYVEAPETAPGAAEMAALEDLLAQGAAARCCCWAAAAGTKKRARRSPASPSASRCRWPPAIAARPLFDQTPSQLCRRSGPARQSQTGGAHQGQRSGDRRRARG